MAEPGFTDTEPQVGEWYQRCTCGHSWLHHDVETLENDRPSCCFENCPCGPGSYFADQTNADYE